MRRFKINKINALDSKGKSIAGTIQPVHSDYWLDSEAQGKLHLFGLARRGRSLEQAKSLRLEIIPASVNPYPQGVRVKVLHADSFGLEEVSRGDYWDEVPEQVRYDIQNTLADELMDRAKSEPSLFQFQREPYPYQGVAFVVSELEELAALFPPE